jgi:hypothetical protein
MHLYVVEHLHVQDDGEEDVKLIGVYSTRARAEQAADRLRLKAGFCDTPEGFTIDTYTLDEDSWQDGYTTIVHSDSEKDPDR